MMNLIDKARALRQLIEKAAKSLTDTDALDAVELFPNWKEEKDYAVGDRVRYDGTLYSCVQAHTPQIGWEPPKVPALFKETAEPGEIPVWKQPTGAQDAYNKGDKVHYPAAKDPVYESLIDANVYSPEVYPQGWKLIG